MYSSIEYLEKTVRKVNIAEFNGNLKEIFIFSV